MYSLRWVRDQPFSWAQLGKQATKKVAVKKRYLRSVNVVHRDLKPNNIFYDDRRALWKILDFGVSKIHDSSGTLTHGDAIGTPSYMAPELLGAGVQDLAGDGLLCVTLSTGALHVAHVATPWGVPGAWVAHGRAGTRSSRTEQLQ